MPKEKNFQSVSVSIFYQEQHHSNLKLNEHEMPSVLQNIFTSILIHSILYLSPSTKRFKVNFVHLFQLEF